MKNIAVAAALLALSASGWVRAQEIFSESKDLYSTRELIMSTQTAPGSQIVISSAATLVGKLSIVASRADTVNVTYFKKAKTTGRSRAIDYIDLIAVSLERLPGGIRVEMRAPNPAPWGSTEEGLVEARLVIPQDCHVSIEAPYFDVEAVGPFKSFVVPNSLGRFDVKDVTERLEISTSNRRLTIENVTGDINVATSNSTLSARNVTSLDGKAVFRNDGGDIKIEDIAGEIDVKNSYARIEVDRFSSSGKKSYVRGTSGPIILNITKMDGGELIVTNRLEDVEISVPQDISARFSLAVEEQGRIEVSHFPFQTDLVQQNRLELVSGEGLSLIAGSVRGRGNIYIRAISEGK